MRYSFAFYLVPAGVAKLWPAAANVILVAWSALGIYIFLASVAMVSRRHRSTSYVFVVVAVLFSGLSIPPALLQWTAFADFQASVLDAWSRSLGCGWLLGSNGFSLRWAPQHTICSWVGASLLVFHTREQWFWKACPLLTVALLLWSPFVALAFAAIAGLVATKVDLRRKVVDATFNVTTVGVLLIGVWVLKFLMSDTAAIPLGICDRGSPVRQAAQYGLFVALTFGTLALLVAMSAQTMERVTVGAIALLLVLPLTYVGTSNDLQMRASELPFGVLLFATLKALASPASPRLDKALRLVVLIGCLAGLQEISRAAGAVSLEWQADAPTMMRLVAEPAFTLGDPSIEHQYIAAFPRQKRFTKSIRLSDSASDSLARDDGHR